MIKNKDRVVDELKRILGYIEKGTNFTEEDKQKITEETVKYTRDNLNPGWLKYRKAVSKDYTIIEWSDGGEFFYDLDGNSYADFLGGYGIFTTGHRNPEILEVVMAQINNQCMDSHELLEPIRAYLAKIMWEITPGDLKHCFFTNGGAEAVEMALKLAQIASGKKWFISTVNAFHGKSMGALSVTGKNIYRKPYLPLLQNVQHVEYGVAEDILKAIKNLEAVGESVAAVILEPIQGEAGVIIPPEGYLRKVREICDECNVFLIIDEIQTGLGRTGSMWRCETEDIVPDIMTFGKAFGGGLVPATGLIARDKLWVDKLIEEPELLGSPTFGGNPLSSTAAIAAIRYIIKEDVPNMCKEKGEKIMGILKKLKIKYPKLLIDVRGVGLLIAMEFPKTEIGYFVAKNLFENHFLTAGTLNNSKVIRIEPPAVVSEKSIDKLGDTLDKIFYVAYEKFDI